MSQKLSVHQVFIAIHLLSALLTAIPRAGASKVCRLGYKALCSSTPYGTITLLALAALHIYLHRKSVVGKSQ